jgi:hypothetical protein
MSKEAKIIIGVVALCIGLVVWRFNVQTSSKSTEAVEEVTPAQPNSPATDDESQTTQVTSAPVRPKIPAQDKAALQNTELSFSFKIPKDLPQEQQELQSLERYTKALYLFASGQQRPELLVQKLTEAGLKPLVVQDFNDLTGKMIVIKTEETLPGTRYFYAQYFEDENKQPFLQHMSFEFRPGEKSLDESVAYVRAAFPKNVGAPQFCTKNYAAWEYGEMTAYCHQLTKEDVERDDAIRARSSEDIGAVKCAIEQNPHPQDDLCH